jgi:carbamoyl-phosphate synthase large subunit
MLQGESQEIAMNILITSASRKVSLVQAFQRALAGRGLVIAVDSNPYSPALYLADKHRLVPPSSDPRFVDYLVRLCQELEIRLLVPTRDEELVFFAENRSHFEAVGTKVHVSDPNAIRTCQDKWEFYAFCVKHGFGTPRTYDSTRLSEDLTYPVFVKPRWGKGSLGAQRVDTGIELQMLLERSPAMVIQEYLQAPEFTLDVFADFLGRVLSVVPRERLRVIAGESYVGRTRKDSRLIGEGMRLVKALGLIGHNTVQCFLHKGEVKFIEVNPRYGGGANLGFAAGAPTPLYLVKLLNGEELNPMIGDVRENYVMLRYSNDLFVDEAALAKGEVA